MRVALVVCGVLALAACSQKPPGEAVWPGGGKPPGYQPPYPPYERVAVVPPSLSGNLAVQSDAVHMHQGDLAVCQ